jgi:hypothetical protein
MKLLRKISVTAALLLSTAAGAAEIQAFKPGNPTVLVSATTTSANVALPGTGGSLLVFNSCAVPARIAFTGNAAATPVAGTSHGNSADHARGARDWLIGDIGLGEGRLRLGLQCRTHPGRGNGPLIFQLTNTTEHKMKIERIIVEMPELHRLEKAVDDTATITADWKRHAAAIETELNTANASLARAQEHRSTHALQASLGEAAAIAAVEIARSEQHSAEQTIGDLQISLPQAQAKLAGAEKAAESARRELAKFLAEKIMKKRIEVAGQLDSAIAEFARLFNEFEKLGNEIANAGAVPRNMFGVSDHDGAIGLRRVRAALPKFLDKVFPNSLHDENFKESLAVSEARHWNLPAESETKAA